ncbi:hypothetical protein [Maridesulfovibrio hydrothermalis]|uniref:Uncharacterized protein n=1 Tax=Maridesulfovibrio hydrothermalis AM13 = DSM 14728 TaxID=1121451 RepID=L0RB15_9BACT|nr:hypothetical protein [Maridesulfovibrio hydrothermalis]CCO23390.1 membrane protein of unknown function [Maridesulfovibrio hydrothermalis AM13 = DSM 14728]
MFKLTLEYLDEIVAKHNKLLFVCVVVLTLAGFCIKSAVLFRLVLAAMASGVSYSLTREIGENSENCTLVLVVSVVSFFVVINFIPLFIFGAEFITLKYFFGLYSVCYLSDIDLSFSTLLVFSMLAVYIFPYFAALIKFDFKLIKAATRSINEYVLQLMVGVTIVLALFVLNSIAYKSVEVYTATLIAKAVLAVLVLSLLSAYMLALKRKAQK